MAKTEESNVDNDELKQLDREISKLRSAKKEIFERIRFDNDELERIAKRERECVDKQHRLRTEQHERERHQQTVQRVIELECELKRAKCENEKLSDTVRKLKQSLDQATKYSKVQRQKLAEMEIKMAFADGKFAEARSETGDSVSAVEWQKQLDERNELLSMTKRS